MPPLSIYYATADHAKPKYSSGQEILGVQGGWQPSAGHDDQILTSVWLLDPPVQPESDDQLVITLSGEVSPVRISVSPIAGLDPLAIGNETQLKKLGFDFEKLKDDETISVPENDNFNLAAVLSAPVYKRVSDYEDWVKIKKLAQEYHECRNGKAWTLITKSLPKPLPVRVFPRGNWQDESQPEIMPATLHFLPGPKAVAGKRLTRLDLANWICCAGEPADGADDHEPVVEGILRPRHLDSGR